MWVLSRCPKTEAVIRFNRGKILFEVPHEFRVTAIFDFQRLVLGFLREKLSTFKCFTFYL